MAYSRAYIRSFARDASLTIDHEMYTKMLLADLPVLTVPELLALDLADIDERTGHEKFTIHQAAALYLHSIFCSPAQLEGCYSEFESQRLAKLDLPLLKTDPENDLYGFKRSMKCQQAQQFETLRTVDIGSIDRNLLDARTAKILDPHDNQGIEQFSCVVSQAARDLMKSITSTEAVSCAEWQSSLAMKLTDPFYFEFPMAPLPESKQPLVDDSSGLQSSSTTAMDCKTEDFEIMEIDDKQCQPGDAMDNPHIIDSHEDEFARISVTPEVEMHPVIAERSRKLGSPLTPPNSIRSHRKLQGKNPKKIIQSTHLPITQSAPSCPLNCGSTMNTSVLQETRYSDREQTLSWKFRTRKTLRKIELNNLNHTQAPSSKSSALDLKALTSFKQELREIPSMDMRDWAWAPWAPFQFDEDAFQSQFDISPGGETVRSFEIPEPIDPRTLLSFLNVEEDNSDTLGPLKLARPWDLFPLPRKRTLDSVYDVKDCKDHLPGNLEKVQVLDAFENSFPSMAFELLANNSVQLKKPKVTASTRSAPKNDQPPNKGYDISRTSISSLELAPQPVISRGNFQLIVTSCGVMARQAIRLIHLILSGVEVVERDFMARWISKDGVPGDADIILSPQTCIMLATIEEIQQKPLPGTLSVSGFQRRIAILTPKFETIYVLVRTKNGGDRSIYLQCRTSVEQEGRMSDTVIHIEDFEENQAKEALYHRIVYLMRQEHIQLLNLDLIEEETYWERYLRKEIGVNAYAAQVIIRKSWAATINGREESLSALRYLNKDKCLRDLNDILGKKSSRLLSKALSRFEDARVDVLLGAENLGSPDEEL